MYRESKEVLSRMRANPTPLKSHDSNDLISRISDWFVSQCDGDWEHGEGIVLESMDDPGWMLTIGIDGTSLHGKTFESIEIEGEEEFFSAKVENGRFIAMGDASSLRKLLTTFLDFASGSDKQ